MSGKVVRIQIEQLRKSRRSEVATIWTLWYSSPAISGLLQRVLTLWWMVFAAVVDVVVSRSPSICDVGGFVLHAGPRDRLADERQGRQRTCENDCSTSIRQRGFWLSEDASFIIWV